MSSTELRKNLQAKISQLSDDQLQELLAIVDQRFPENTSLQSNRKHLLGALPGLIKYMSPDFNKPLEDFEDYMPDRHPGG